MDGTVSKTALLLLGICACGPRAGPDASSPGGTAPASSSGSASGASGATSRGATTATGSGGATAGASGTAGSVSTTGEACPDWPFEGCAASFVPSQVSGDTPLGPVDVPVAAFAASTACYHCVYTPNVTVVYMAGSETALPTMPAVDTPPDGDVLILVLDVFGFQGPVGQPVSGQLRIWRDGMVAATDQVVFTLDAIPDAEALGEPFSPEGAVAIAGTFEADDGGDWKVSGSFVAGYCPRLNTFLVCE